MRAAVVVAALLSASVRAQPAAQDEWVPFPLRVGADVGALMRQEAGGQRTPLPALVLRGAYGELGPLTFGVVYQFAFAREGTLVRGFTQHHRLHLRPEAVWHLRSAFLSVSAGPGVQWMHTALSAPERTLTSSLLRGCVGAELSVGVQLGDLRLRTGVDVTYAPGRLDLLASVGGSFGFWGEE